MARVPLIGEERADLAPLIARLKTARGGRLINLYRMLLNSPRIAAAWLDFNSAVRFETELPDDVRELAIMRVSALNGPDYQLRIHGAAYARKAGLTVEPIAALTAPAIPAGTFAPRDEAVLAYLRRDDPRDRGPRRGLRSPAPAFQRTADRRHPEGG